MSLLSHEQLLDLVEEGVLEGVRDGAVNSASIDIHLGRFILVEELPTETKNTGHCKILSLSARDPLTTKRIDLFQEKTFLLRPGQFILAQSAEIFHLPCDISAEYKLKSSMARIGLEHLNAGWCDAGWNGSVLTLELRNLTTYHEIELCLGDAIGQMVFFKHLPVGAEASYANRGRYNGDREVSGAKASVSKTGAEDSSKVSKTEATVRNAEVPDVRKT